MTERCADCTHWTDLNEPRRGKGKAPRMGTCIAVKCFTDFRITGGGGCPDCDPYSMNETQLETAETFGCKYWASLSLRNGVATVSATSKG
jgi:hypothetical protein